MYGHAEASTSHRTSAGTAKTATQSAKATAVAASVSCARQQQVPDGVQDRRAECRATTPAATR